MENKNDEWAPDCPGAAAIIKAATPLFARRGFDQVSLSEVAAAAGISKANIFHHYRSNEGLYQAVLVAACCKPRHLLNDMLVDTGFFEERLSRFALPIWIIYSVNRIRRA